MDFEPRRAIKQRRRPVRRPGLIAMTANRTRTGDSLRRVG